MIGGDDEDKRCNSLCGSSVDGECSFTQLLLGDGAKKGEQEEQSSIAGVPVESRMSLIVRFVDSFSDEVHFSWCRCSGSVLSSSGSADWCS